MSARGWTLLRTIAVVAVGGFSPILVVVVAMALGLPPQALQGSGFSVSVPQIVALLGIVAVSAAVPVAAQVFLRRRPVAALFGEGRHRRAGLGGLGLGLGVAGLVLLTRVGLATHVECTVAVPSKVSVPELAGAYAFFLVVVVLLNSLKEELVFRAYPLTAMRDRDRRLLIVVSATLFAAVHLVLEPPSVSGALDRWLYGILFAQVYLMTSSLWGAIGVHSGVNLVPSTFSGDWTMGGFWHLRMRHDIALDWVTPLVVASAIGLLALRSRWTARRPAFRTVRPPARPASRRPC